MILIAKVKRKDLKANTFCENCDAYRMEFWMRNLGMMREEK